MSLVAPSRLKAISVTILFLAKLDKDYISTAKPKPQASRFASPILSINWESGEPNNWNGNEDYGWFWTTNSGKWADIGNANYKGVIESNIDPSTVTVPSTYKIQIATPDLISQSYVVGDVVSGAISIKGDQRYYTFSGKAGQRLYLDSQTKTAGFKIRITDPVAPLCLPKSRSI